MLNGWHLWLTSLTWDEVALLLLGMSLLDGPRYCVATAITCIYDWMCGIKRSLFSNQPEAEFSHCPSVCVMVVGLNEGSGLGATIESIIGTYPRLEIVVVDDGSDDDMAEVGRAYASQHPGIVRCLSRPWRGGKSSALNIAATHTKAEVVICVDADSHLASDAIWEIVQPFRDENVGAVSATVSVRNCFTNFVTWFQGLEYLQSIFVGRLVAARLNVLPIASGALAGFRRELLVRLGGWDVGPGEDLDMTVRIRRLGYRVTFAQYAFCHTEAPTTWKALLKQRRRWEGDGPVRHFSRKHIDMAKPWHRNFNLSNMFMFLDGITFNLLCGYGMVIWSVMVLLNPGMRPDPYAWMTFYVVSVIAEIIALGPLMYYSRQRKHDAIVALAFPLMPAYRMLLLGVRIFSNTAEILWRKSFTEPHVPPHIRAVTWRW
jgi:biofilm PGA synthesis N-glycosyltransferase PgaC